MIIEIDDSKTIDDIQEKFNDFFPFLKMEFYKHPHRWSEGSVTEETFPGNTSIGEIRKNHVHGDMKIYSWQKTGSVEQEFRNRFGINVQIFRLHGNTWVQTAGTDDLSLHEQNETGMNASHNFLQDRNTD